MVTEMTDQMIRSVYYYYYYDQHHHRHHHYHYYFQFLFCWPAFSKLPQLLERDFYTRDVHTDIRRTAS